MSHLILSLKKEWQKRADLKIAEKQRLYLKNNFYFMGLQKPLRFEIQKNIFKAYPISNEKALIDLLYQLWDQKEREFHYAALDLAAKHSSLWSENMFGVFEFLIRHHSWWDSVDTIAGSLLGKLLQRFSTLTSEMDKWIHDEPFWVRRSALLFQLKWKTKTDEKRLFHYCTLTMAEREFFICKAIGWALREYSKTAPSTVRAFVEAHQDHLSSLSTKEALRLL